MSKSAKEVRKKGGKGEEKWAHAESSPQQKLLPGCQPPHLEEETITGLVTHFKKRKRCQKRITLDFYASFIFFIVRIKTEETHPFVSPKFEGTFNNWDLLKIDDLELLTTVEVKGKPLYAQLPQRKVSGE